MGQDHDPSRKTARTLDIPADSTTPGPGVGLRVTQATRGLPSSSTTKKGRVAAPYQKSTTRLPSYSETARPLQARAVETASFFRDTDERAILRPGWF